MSEIQSQKGRRVIGRSTERSIQMCTWSMHLFLCISANIWEKERRRREHKREKCSLGRKKAKSGHIRTVLSVSYSFSEDMVRAKFISLSRIWYTIIVIIIHLILVYFGIKQCYFNDRLPWPKSSSLSPPTFELLIQKICLLSSVILLFIFIYPALFQIGNFSNDNQQLTMNDLNKNHLTKSKKSLSTSLWHHCFSLSSTLHLSMSFLIIISNVLIDAKQIMIGLKDSGRDCFIKLLEIIYHCQGK